VPICDACGNETSRVIVDERGRELSVGCYWKEHPVPHPAVCDGCGRHVQWTIPYRGGRYGEHCYFVAVERLG
jgi:hypothetical protein